MTHLAGRTAVITGAGSGIGRALAIALARRGCNLALADINAAGLAETAALLAGGGVVSQHVLDVASREQVAALPVAVLAAHKGVDLLFNNAGVALGGFFQQLSAEEFDWLFEINFHGLVRMTRAFLPLLQASDDARLVNLSSIFGLIATPGQTAYAASKYAVRGFSEALRTELAGSRIAVTVVHPGGVATRIATSARVAQSIGDHQQAEQLRQKFNKSLRLEPAAAGEIIVRAVERRQNRVLVGNDAKLLALIERVAPVSYWKVIELLFPEARKKK
jgi:NADP-dependent 3-hydroxy acid dehydrogenase YdfG